MRKENRKGINEMAINKKHLKEVINKEIEIYAITQAEVSKAIDEGKIKIFDQRLLTSQIYDSIAKNYHFQ